MQVKSIAECSKHSVILLTFIKTPVTLEQCSHGDHTVSFKYADRPASPQQRSGMASDAVGKPTMPTKVHTLSMLKTNAVGTRAVIATEDIDVSLKISCFIHIDTET